MKRLLIGALFGKPKQTAGSRAAKEEEEDLTSLDEREIALRDAFNRFDKNKDGFIDKQELSELLETYLHLKEPPSDVELGRIMAKVDLNQNGKIEFQEFKMMMSKKNKARNKYLTTFQNFDVDGDGFISREELGDVLKEVYPDTKEEELDSIMKSLDQDNDGKISYQEFLNYFE